MRIPLLPATHLVIHLIIVYNIETEYGKMIWTAMEQPVSIRYDRISTQMHTTALCSVFRSGQAM